MQFSPGNADYIIRGKTINDTRFDPRGNGTYSLVFSDGSRADFRVSSGDIFGVPILLLNYRDAGQAEQDEAEAVLARVHEILDPAGCLTGSQIVHKLKGLFKDV